MDSMMKCVICGKVVKSRATLGKNPYFLYPVTHEGMVAGQPCHGFYVEGVAVKGEKNV